VTWRPGIDHTAPLTFAFRAESWPLAEAFVISRGSKTAAEVVVVEARMGGAAGRGEAVPYARYGETTERVLASIGAWAARHAATATVAGSELAGLRQELQSQLPAGAARNAIDCALWDLEAKCTGKRVADLLGEAAPQPCLTAYTLSLGTAESMAAKAAAVRHLPLLKLKLGGEGDHGRMLAVRAARPDARLIVDANEAWSVEQLPGLLATAAATGIEVVEQPLPESLDEALRDRPRGVAICADESLHTRAELDRVAGLYDAINVKLDKAGGLTEAHGLAAEAGARGLKIMAGCMVATSLAMAPALLLTARASWVDLDGPLLLAHDREHGLIIRDGLISPPMPELWG